MNLYLLGVTGSIGQQTLDILRKQQNKFNLISVSAYKNIELLKSILEEFSPKYATVHLKEDKETLEKRYPSIEFGYGQQGLIKAATYGEKTGLLINAVVGSAGLKPTIEAIKKKRNIALANKETLVIGGEIIMPLVKKHQVSLIPIDSEHSAIMQCLNGEDKSQLKQIIITASGGSFRDLSRKDLKDVTLKDALNHPNWSMGSKITIDSATMMNKGFEVIEAHHLFNVPYKKIKTILHKESIVHSLVEFKDTSIIAHLGNPDMRVPINYALFYPNRTAFNSDSLSLEKVSSLHFEALDETRYPLLSLAKEVGQAGGLLPTVLNASNEAAVQLFLNETISFLQIEDIVIQCINKFKTTNHVTLENIIALDEEVKQFVYDLYT